MRLLALVTILMTLKAAASDPPLNTVPSVDLKRYAGKWYEIARYPNRFQRNCTGDVTANYTLRADGKVAILNSCREKEGKTNQAKGTAKVADRQSNAKLKVTFFWPFYGDYWIVDLAPDYSYAIVGEPKRDYLWILSRKPQMDANLYNLLLEKIRAAGYDPTRLVKTPQSNVSG
jgi:apolipoprotein D and lipocalin family protein